MIIVRLLAAILLMIGLSPAALAQATGTVKVAIATNMGRIVVALDTRRAPITANNFLRYVDDKRFDNTTFYRASRMKGYEQYGLIQGGTDHNIRRAFLPIAHEPTSKTGLRHVDGTISMARNDPGTAMADWFITVGATPSMDAKGDYPGYAAFGRVVEGMAVVKKILALPTYPRAGLGAMRGQLIIKRPKILTVRRLK